MLNCDRGHRSIASISVASHEVGHALQHLLLPYLTQKQKDCRQLSAASF
ncbi:zinc metallopeptidase [Bacillus sonorensis]